MEAALRRGANAVVALRFDTAPVGIFSEVHAYGTAVVIGQGKGGGKGSGEGKEGGGESKKKNDVSGL